jgi:hypothetical protein
VWVHNSAFLDRDVIVGDAFIVGPPDHHGNDRSVPDELVTLLFNTKRFRLLAQRQGEAEPKSNSMVFEHWFDAYLNAIQTARHWSRVEEVRIVADE